MGIDTNKYIVGISNNHSTLDELVRGTNESFYAVNTGEISQNYITLYKDIGIYKLIMPFVHEVYAPT